MCAVAAALIGRLRQQRTDLVAKCEHIERLDNIADRAELEAIAHIKRLRAGGQENHWEVPAAFLGIVRDGKVAYWETYSDASIVFDLIKSQSTAEGVEGKG